MDEEPRRSIDVRGSACPIPVIELATAIDGVDVGELVEVLSDDPTSKVDVPIWCRLRGHELVSRRDVEDRGWGFVVRRRS